MRSPDFLRLAALIGRLEFRAMSDQERIGFAGASDDALVCDTGAVDEVAATLDAPVPKYGYLAVLSGDRLELHAVDEDGESVTVIITLTVDVDAS